MGGGGGLAFYIKQKYTNFKDSEDLNTTSIDLESLWTTIKIPKMRNVVIRNIDRPPQENVPKFINSFEHQIKAIHDKQRQPFDLFIVCDLNIE